MTYFKQVVVKQNFPKWYLRERNQLLGITKYLDWKDHVVSNVQPQA